MVRDSKSSRAGHATGSILLVGAVLVSAGCSGSSDPPIVSRARAVFDEVIAARPDHAAFGLSLADGSDAEVAHQLLMSSIEANDRRIALEAIKLLGSDPPGEAQPALARVFAEKRGAVKLQAAVALARLGDAEALAWLREEVGSSQGLLNASAMAIVAEHGDEETVVSVLRARIGSDERSIRDEAYAVLGEVGQPWATRLLLEGLDKEFGEERLQPIVSLGLSGDADVAPRLQKFVNTQGLVFASIEALGRLGNPASAKALEPMVDHDEGLVRVYTGVALMKLGATEIALQALEPLVGDEATTVRRNLAEQLGDVDAAAATELLVRLAADESGDVRVAALRGLASRATPELAALFLDASEDADYQVGTLALNGLARSGSADAWPRLEPLLEDENPYVALSAAHAVLSIHARDPGASGGA